MNILQTLHIVSSKSKIDVLNVGKGKYLYDVFYDLPTGEGLTGSIRGNNITHAKENFICVYGNVKINHTQRYPKGW